MGKTSLPGKRRIREIYDLRAILNAVWNRLRFTVTGSGAEHLTITQTGGVVSVDFDTDGLGGDPGPIEIGDVDGLGDALTALGDEIDGKADASHTHDDRYYTESETDTLLSGKAASSHTHDDRYYTESETDTLLSGKAAASHTHDDRYYTESETDTLLSGKAASSHTHDDRYYTESETDTLLSGKAASSHTHGNLTNAGAIGSTSGLPIKTGTGGVLEAGAFGTSAGQFCQGNDSRLSDARTPTTHNHNASDIDAGTLDADRLPVAGTTTIGGVKRNEGADGQYIKGFDSDGTAMYDEPVSLVYRPGWNLLANGNFVVQQRGTVFTSSGGGNNDGAYTADRWFILSDGNDVIDVDFAESRIDLDTETANKKFGIAQIVEFADVLEVRDGSLTLSFSANWSVIAGAVDHVKAAILGWTGTADAPTHDFISAWNGDDTLPTLAASWEFLSTPTDLLVGSSSTLYEITATPTSSHKNIAVFIWSDSTSSTVGNTLQIRNAQLEVGGSYTSFQFVPYVDQLARCQRFYEVLRYSDDGIAVPSFFRATNINNHTWYFKATKRVKPTISSTLATGSWSGGLTPTVYPGIDSASFFRSTTFGATGTTGNIALAADAEL